jgi:hypothetical protein
LSPDTVPQLARDQLENFQKSHNETYAIWILIGGREGLWALAMAAVIVLYNALRAFLTLRVNLLRDAEERAQITPSFREYHGPYRCHRFASVLLFIAIASVAWNTAYWIGATTIWIPLAS